MIINIRASYTAPEFRVTDVHLPNLRVIYMHVYCILFAINSCVASIHVITQPINCNLIFHLKTISYLSCCWNTEDKPIKTNVRATINERKISRRYAKCRHWKIYFRLLLFCFNYRPLKAFISILICLTISFSNIFTDQRR